MKYRRLLALSAGLGAMSVATGAHAISLGDGAVQLSGFGTLGFVHSSYKDADFVANGFEASGAGHTRSWSPKVDSKLGVQMDADLGRGLAAVVQVVSRQNAHGNFQPSIEWANLSYEATSNLTLRIGRTVLPTYMRADSQHVGYTLPFVRLPGEIAYANPVTNSDGVDVSYRLEGGGLKHNLQVQVGRTHGRVEIGAFEANRAVSVFDTIEWGDNSVHVGHERITYRLSGLPESELKVVALGFLRETDGYFAGVDTQYADDGIQGQVYFWYANAGLKIGDWSPYVTYARTRMRLRPYPGVEMASPSQRTAGVGVRWNLAHNMALKAQFDEVCNRNPLSPVSFTRIQPSAQSGDKARLLSVALDFIF